MKTLSLLQPWASLVALGAKQFETRSWATSYRGDLAIHASKSKKSIDFIYKIPGMFDALSSIPRDLLPFGKIIAVVRLVTCVKIPTPDQVVCGFYMKQNGLIENYQVPPGGSEKEFGDYTPGRYAWIFSNIRQIEPISAKGSLGLWEWNQDEAT
jgi:hypothetical protein